MPVRRPKRLVSLEGGTHNRGSGGQLEQQRKRLLLEHRDLLHYQINQLSQYTRPITSGGIFLR